MVTGLRHACRCLAITAALCLAACTSPADPDPPPSSAPSSGVVTASSGVVAAPSAVPSSAAAATGLPPAADGSRLSACKDGRCEVVVSQEKTITLNRSIGLYAVAVSRIQGDEIGLFASMRSGGSFACDGDPRCQVSVQGASGQLPPSAQFVAHPGARLEVAKLRIEVVAVADDEAVLRLSTGK